MELSQIFIKILNMSLMASYCIAVVIALRFFLKRQSKLFSYLLWSVVAFRLLCPFSLSSAYSLLRMDTDIISQESIDRLSSDNINEAWQVAAPDNMMPEGQMAAAVDATASHIADIEVVKADTWAQKIFAAAAWVWVIGIVMFICYGIITTLRMRYLLSGAVCVGDNVYEAEGIDTPFVFGIVRPRIYLPAHIQDVDKRYVLEHERIHIERKDYLVKISACAAVCLHWFNPLVWLAFVLMESDMEMSCDEAVLKRLGEDIKKEYSRSLLSLSCERRIFQISPLAFGEVNVKGRIRNILSYKKKTLITVVVAAALIIIIGVGLVLNPEKKEAVSGTESDVSLSYNTEIEAIGVVQFVEDFANATIDRDGAAIASMYIDEDTALANEVMMYLEKVGDGYTYGISSPWPIDFRYEINAKDQKADIWYYASTSDPHISVWKKEIQYTKVGEEYKVEKSSVKFLDEISSKEEFDEAYLINDEYCFVDYMENGFFEGTVYQILEGNSDTDNSVYEKPETAAAYILNLTGGEGVVEGDYTSVAMVRYTFADNSEVMIPMNAPIWVTPAEESESKNPPFERIWIVDTGVWNAKAP